MVVTTIYVSRHGFRGTYSLDASTGVYTSNIVSPTGIPADPPLVAYGVQQSYELAVALAAVVPPIARVYSSPYYRCLETIRPTAKKLGLEIRADNGLGEWYGRAPFSQPKPALPSILSPFFPSLSMTYSASCYPPKSGESIPQLHARCAFVLSQIITHVDSETGGDPVAIAVCTHAAPLIAIGRVLTGHMPADFQEDDFMTFTAGITRFDRRDLVNVHRPHEVAHGLSDGNEVPYIGWMNGKGVMGGWDCVLNSDCRHLKGGAERGWHFSGDESFSDTMQESKL